MLSYEFGLLVAFCLWFWAAANALVILNSRLERNLNKVGQRLSWVSLTPTAMEANDLQRSTLGKIFRFLLVYGAGLILVVTSWLYVALVIGTAVYRRSKDSGAPPAVREFRWKLRNRDLTFDEIVMELMKLSDQDAGKFEEVKQEIINGLRERGLTA